MYEDTRVLQCNSDPLLMHLGWVLFDFLFVFGMKHIALKLCKISILKKKPHHNGRFRMEFILPQDFKMYNPTGV